ncbi:MAG: DUF2183 domain-containing protein [Promicromonosporaceae bacterium]|nr:DUF2183 domain-containing protein [Promicromonosporaceae bacterium]
MSFTSVPFDHRLEPQTSAAALVFAGIHWAAMQYGIAARVEDTALNMAQAVVHGVFDWLPRVEAYTGIGTLTQIRVLCRTLLSPAERVRERPSPPQRGLRSYICLPADGEQVEIRIGTQSILTVTDRTGYIDQVITLLEPVKPGWHTVHFTTPRSGATSHAPFLAVDPAAKVGLVSDIDDTTMITAVPQLAVAAWRTFLEKTVNREPVAGMSALFSELISAYPTAPVIYLSNGAWNSAPALRRFLARWHFPPGPLLLTDFGPTATGFFRSGKTHKRQQIRWLMEFFPDIGWFLFGDNGQSDPEIYSEAAREYPNRVAAIAIRTLNAVQRILWLAGAFPAEIPDNHDTVVPFVAGANGDELGAELRKLGLLPSLPNPSRIESRA